MTDTTVSRVRRRRSLVGRGGVWTCLIGIAALALSACDGASETDSTAGTLQGTTSVGTSASMVSPASTTGSASTVPSASSGTAGSTGSAAHDLLPADIIQRGYINVPMTFGAPPGAFTDESGGATGQLIDLSNALSKPLGVEVKIINTPWDSVLAGIKSGRYDAQIGQVRITDERRQQMNFVTLQKFQLEMMISAKNESTLRDWPDFCGREVSQLVGSLQIETVVAQSKKYCDAAGKPAITGVTFKDPVDMYQAVLIGRVAGTLNDASTVGYQIKQSNGQLQRASEIMLVDQPIGIAVGAGQPQLAKALAAALQELMDDGTYGEILAKWGMADLALTTAEFLPVTGGSSETTTTG